MRYRKLNLEGGFQKIAGEIDWRQISQEGEGETVERAENLGRRGEER